MAVIDLPDWPGAASATPTLVDFGGVQEGATGGAAQAIDRQGNRWAWDIAMPIMEHDDDGRLWSARLVRGQRLGVRMDVPLGAGNQGAPGLAVVVDGAGQAGTSLAVRGCNAGYVAREGYWLSIVDAAGNHYLHQMAATVMVGDAGTATLPIEPMLRHPFADGAAVHLAAPKVQGLLVGNERSWTINTARHVGIGFTIRERK